ncbi:MAG: inositol-3-phosphate synthase [Planctomycetota bacterium]
MADKTGIWLVGARGAVATTVAVGMTALQKRAVDRVGLVTELPMLRELPLASWDQLVVGGHELRRGNLVDGAAALARDNRLFTPELLAACREELVEIDSRIRPGIHFRGGDAAPAGQDATRRVESPRVGIERIKNDLLDFRQANNLGRVVVVLLASTEPETPRAALPDRWGDLRLTLETNAACVLRSSSLYAIAALELGHPLINFTPSLGSDCTAIGELALERGACHAGRDGKTGETLLKTVLAPMFAARNLEVMSWVGHNILGNADGRVLDHPEHKQAKLQSKDSALSKMLGYDPQSLVSIEYIKSLGDWKTAWDHVHFKGFLGTPMTLQFTWQGCDSALAAPLVIDLARLADHAARRGETGALTYLASFFKRPYGANNEDFFSQLGTLAEYVRGVLEGDPPRTGS